MTTYKGHTIKPFQQFTGVWLAVYSGPLSAGTARGYTKRHATARAKLAVLREYRSRADKSNEVLNNERRRANRRGYEGLRALWADQRRLEGLPPPFRVRGCVDTVPKDMKESG
jgi:hypothetical protein